MSSAYVGRPAALERTEALIEKFGGIGVEGKTLVVDSLDWARESGYAAMQFNAVVATNTDAVKLYESLGFTVVGTVPRAHELPSGERVGRRIMHVDL